MRLSQEIVCQLLIWYCLKKAIICDSSVIGTSVIIKMILMKKLTKTQEIIESSLFDMNHQFHWPLYFGSQVPQFCIHHTRQRKPERKNISILFGCCCLCTLRDHKTFVCVYVSRNSGPRKLRPLEINKTKRLKKIRSPSRKMFYGHAMFIGGNSLAKKKNYL